MGILKVYSEHRRWGVIAILEFWASDTHVVFSNKTRSFRSGRSEVKVTVIKRKHTVILQSREFLPHPFLNPPTLIFSMQVNAAELFLRSFT
jgi:hypothetical protein